MEENRLRTHFAPAERMQMDVIWKQYASFVENRALARMLNSLSVAVVISNPNRQVIYLNKAMLKLLGTTNIKSLIGLRLGEAIGCIHSGEMEAGCGTSIFCRECGAIRAILSVIDGKMDEQECKITLHDAHALDLRIFTSPMELDGQNFSILSIHDIADEKRKALLERVFLHDVRNTAGGIQGFSNLLLKAGEDQLDFYKGMINDLSDRLVDEIDSYIHLAMAENDTLSMNLQPIDSMELLSHVKHLYMNHEVANGKTIRIDPESQHREFISDRVLLGRVLGNMVKNALEASRDGEEVTLYAGQKLGQVHLSVHNPGAIPESARLQVFKRSFSTKGEGRGIGTYSIRLFTEKYLKGKAGFRSSKEGGTSFYVFLPPDL